VLSIAPRKGSNLLAAIAFNLPSPNALSIDNSIYRPLNNECNEDNSFANAGSEINNDVLFA